MANLTYTTAQVQAILDNVAGSLIVIPDSITGLNMRMGVRNSSFVIDKELTVTGFDGIEGTDWENLMSNS